jgi:hypothetical protein
MANSAAANYVENASRAKSKPLVSFGRVRKNEHTMSAGIPNFFKQFWLAEAK